MKKPIRVSMPPALYTDRSGQKWAISGQHWVKVPPTLTLDKVGDYMVYEVTEVAETEPARRWSVEGSKGDIYTVTLRDGRMTCTCPGFGWRGKCRHIETKAKGSENVSRS